jgi:hydroxyacylglutathione hydrolase
MTGGGNWTYLLSGRVSVLIDAGVGDMEHLDAIRSHAPGGPVHVIVTHAHEDHVSGAEALAARWPRATFWKFPWPGRDERYRVEWHPLTDDGSIAAGDNSLSVVHTPGHAPDHICLWHAATRTVFSGDLVVKGSTVVIPASAGGNVAEYLGSLSRIDALGADRLLPAHGDVIDDPHSLIQSYIEHRRERERQILAAILEGLSSVEAISSRIYVELSPVLQPMARESVLAHLIKLEQDGLVSCHGNEWHSRT